MYNLFAVVRCNPPGTVTNGVITRDEVTTAYVYNDLLTYECNTGFTISGSKVLRCNANGRWSSEPPTCERKNLQTLQASAGRYILFSD